MKTKCMLALFFFKDGVNGDQEIEFLYISKIFTYDGVVPRSSTFRTG